MIRWLCLWFTRSFAEKVTNCLVFGLLLKERTNVSIKEYKWKFSLEEHNIFSLKSTGCKDFYYAVSRVDSLRSRR